jgi:hypothetical protein
VYEIEQLKKGLAGIRDGLARTIAEVKAGKYENRESKLIQYASEAGTLLGAAESVTTQLAWVEQTIDQFTPEIALLERLWKAYGSLVCDDRIAEEDLVDLERLALNPQYQTDRRFLAGKITEALGEARDDARECEQQNAIEMLTAAGFVWQETETFEGWERGAERVTIGSCSAHGRADSWYEWILEVNGKFRDTGKSGEFSRLLEAVGISRAVETRYREQDAAAKLVERAEEIGENR